MSLADVATAAVILAAASCVLYRSLWRNKGHCHGCSGGGCGRAEKLLSLTPPGSKDVHMASAAFDRRASRSKDAERSPAR